MHDQEGDDAAAIVASISDPDRFAVIFDRHAPHVHRYVARRLGGEVAADLVAEVFLAAFRRRSRYARDRTDARPWLYGIASNLIKQHRRDEARRWRLLARLPPEPHEPDHAEKADDRISAQAARCELARALAQLSGADRDVLLLIAWEQLTYDEVATALDIPIGTVRSRLNRARGKLRAQLEGLDPHATADMSLEELLSNE